MGPPCKKRGSENQKVNEQKASISGFVCLWLCLVRFLVLLGFVCLWVFVAVCFVCHQSCLLHSWRKKNALFKIKRFWGKYLPSYMTAKRLHAWSNFYKNPCKSTVTLSPTLYINYPLDEQHYTNNCSSHIFSTDYWIIQTPTLVLKRQHWETVLGLMYRLNPKTSACIHPKSVWREWQDSTMAL